MERSFRAEIKVLKRGAGEPFDGEDKLVVTRHCCNPTSLVSAAAGLADDAFQDVMVQAKDLGELGVHVEPFPNESLRHRCSPPQ